jgi:hypothetical protein
MNRNVVLVFLLTVLTATHTALGRIWTDRSGQHKIEAEMVGFQDGQVHLKKTDGSGIKIALEQLSAADQEFVRQVTATTAETKQPPSTTPTEGVVRFILMPMQPPCPVKIDSVRGDGTAQIDRDRQMWGEALRGLAQSPITDDMLYGALSPITEGHYLGLTGLPSIRALQTFTMGALPAEGVRILRVQVLEVLADGKAVVRLAPEAAKQSKAGDRMFLLRPGGSTTAQMQSLPDTIPIGERPPDSGGTTMTDAAAMEQSVNNLKQIGLAMHNFHDVYKSFPPAVIFGPDGKPWHSWRVLILPFVEQAQLYGRYRFDEPWDGPHNKELLREMPAIYHDPVYSGAQDTFTHYAAITGPGTAFPLEPRKPTAYGSTRGLTAAMAGFRNFLDGTSNILLVGSVSPERKIPWMKPEDVTWNDNFPGMGQPGGFAAPYKARGHAVGIFLRGDGSVTAIRDDVSPADWRNLWQVADGHPLGEIPQLPTSTQGPGQPQGLTILEIPIGQPEASARLIVEPLPAMQPPAAGVRPPMERIPPPPPPKAVPTGKEPAVPASSPSTERPKR